jgi:hypothetical protein
METNEAEPSVPSGASNQSATPRSPLEGLIKHPDVIAGKKQNAFAAMEMADCGFPVRSLLNDQQSCWGSGSQSKEE